MRIGRGNDGDSDSLPLLTIVVMVMGWQVVFVVFQEERYKDLLGTTL